MKTPAQIAESIERFQKVFWEKRSGDRPPIGTVDPDIFLPIKFARRPLPPVFSPEDLRPETAATDYEFAAARRRVACDDWMPFASPWRAVPWLEAVCGCPVRCSAGSMTPGHFVQSLEQLADAPLPADAWLTCLRHETERLAAAPPDDCWLSPTILRGPSDVIAAMRGQDKFFCDLYDGLEAIDRAAGRINQLLLDLLDMHFSAVSPKRAGFGHIYGYWAPGPTIVLQEDVLGQCSPAIYRDVFEKYNTEVVKHLGRHVLFHLHSTGMRHWRDVLAIPGLAGLQLTVEANGPPLTDLVPVLREVLERARLILFVDHGFDQLAAALRQLPAEGLYLLLRDDHIRGDAEFRQFTKASWKNQRGAT